MSFFASMFMGSAMLVHGKEDGMSTFARLVAVLLALCRIGMGGVIMYAGFMLFRGEGLLAGSPFDSRLTGIFVILLGLSCILGAIVPSLFGGQDGWDR